ncbi:MAG: outer membrane protein transport protein [Candidatus Dechloromonas phosphoritropha]|nr:outer membrane protein transport protein [Candidatus Dechloromonas phosphoritropha]MBP8786586.1 outer membrane protein transport protein [Azonexus sp.]MBP9228636.1 outer membrane protein transport protein [Azonexus sp.]
MNNITMRTVPALLLLAFSGATSAAGFQLWEQNASGIATSYAGSAAVADNASTIYFNPAGMTRLPGIQLSAGVVGVRPSFKFSNEGSSGLLGSGGNGGDAGGWSAVPNAYLSWQVAPDWFIGLGISSPFGLATEYDNNWIGGYQAIKSEITTVNYNPSLAWKVNDKVSLGLGLSYQTIDAEMTNMTPVGLYRLKGDDGAWGWNAGALFTLSPAMRVGVSYRSTMSYTLDGNRTLGAAPSTSASADLKLPDTVILSVWQQVSDRWEAMGDLSFTRWNTLDKLNVRSVTGTETESFNYDNSWRIAWGAAYKASDAWKVKFGIAYDRTPTSDDNRTARTPDNDRLWFSFGGQWNGGVYGRIDAGYAYLYMKDPSINQTRTFTTPAGAPVGISNLRGSYNDSAHVLGIQYSNGF